MESLIVVALVSVIVTFVFNLVQGKLTQITEARCAAILIRGYIIRMIDYINLLEEEVTEKFEKIKKMPRKSGCPNIIDISEDNNFTPDHNITNWQTIEKPINIDLGLYSKLGTLVVSFFPRSLSDLAIRSISL